MTWKWIFRHHYQAYLSFPVCFDNLEVACQPPAISSMQRVTQRTVVAACFWI